MKKILVACSTLLFVAVMALSCNKNSAKDVATTWLTSFYHLDYETAKTISTEDTKTLIASLQQFTSMVPDSNKKEMKKIVITVKDVKEEGDKAIAKYTTSDSPEKEQSLNLVKQNGKWLVQFSKNDQMSGAGDPAADQQPAGADSAGTTNAGNAPVTDTTTMH
ncbi:MAG: hypothetical protein JWQ38_1590 [Flavipsychrobacter sp.]|nr:hypothetical protein [Flavipsychrobacter sp.]